MHNFWFKIESKEIDNFFNHPRGFFVVIGHFQNDQNGSEWKKEKQGEKNPQENFSAFLADEDAPVDQKIPGSVAEMKKDWGDT